MNRWFVSEPLRGTLAVHAIIGAVMSSYCILKNNKFILLYGSYVLLHHVMGELEVCRNSWGYVEGGMGCLSATVAAAAQSLGAEITTDTVRLLQCALC